MITGSQINYYFVCKRKLWFFSKDLSMEQTSELVALGQLLHELSYGKESKGVEIGLVKFDFINKRNKIIINEVKKSNKIEDAHKWQVLYYIYILKRKGVQAEGLIRYPKLKKIEKVKLTLEKEEKIKQILRKISEVLSLPNPPEVVKKPYCKNCSYYELCFV